MRKFIKYLKQIFHNCPKCGAGFVAYSHSELINTTWIEVYECSNCKNKFV